MKAVGLNYAKAVQDLSNTPKFQLYLDTVQEFDSAPLSHLVVLNPGQENQVSELRRLSGSAAFDACVKSVYRPIFVRTFRQLSDFFRDIVRLRESIGVYQYSRPWGLETFGQTASVLVDEMEPGRKADIPARAESR